MFRELLVFIVVLCISVLIFKFVKNVLLMILNSILGAFAIYGFNYLFSSDILINIWTILIIAVGGIVGFIVVVGSHFLGWAF